EAHVHRTVDDDRGLNYDLGAALAQIRNRDGEIAHRAKIQLGINLHGMSVIAEPLADNKAVRRMHQARKPFHANGLGQDKICAHVEGGAGIRILSDGNGDTGTIAPAFANFAQDVLKIVAAAVEDDSVKAPVAKPIHRVRCDFADLELHAKVAGDALNNTLDLGVA